MSKSRLSARKRQLLLAGEFAALGAGAVILLVFTVSSIDGVLIRNGQAAAVITSALVDLANTDRQVNSVEELTVNPTLTAIAQAKANDMAEKGYFAHTSPEGKDPWYWFSQGNYLFSYAGENLAVDFSDSAEVEKAWMKSPAHRANLLNNNYTEIGIATAVGTYKGHQTTFVVQMFGTPAHAAAAPEPEVENVPVEPTKIATATKVPVQKPVAAPATPTTTVPVVAAVTPATPPAVLGSAATGLAAPERTTLEDLWQIFAASPRTTLRYAYYLFTFLIILALVIETGIEIRKHHTKHVVLVVGLLALMGGLFVAADSLVFMDPVIDSLAAASTP